MLTTTITHTLEEMDEETKETLATKTVAIKEIMELTLQLQDRHLKENYKMGAYTSSVSPNSHIEPHNSRKSIRFCQSYVQIRVTSILMM